MAKAKGGHRGGKAQTAGNATASASSQNGPSKKADKENSSDLQNTNSAKGGRGPRGGDRGHREKQAKIINNDDQKADQVEDGLGSSPATNHVSEIKKEPHHKVVQPTTEQLMIAKIIDHSDDPHQRKKIQQVMDVTGKPEDEVATALFDAGWDESRAVELLLEDGDHLSAWEETGKKKKGKKANEDKEDWENDGHEGFQDPRGSDKSRSRGGRGRGFAGGRGGSNAKFHANHAENNGEHHPSRGEGGPPRRGNGPPRRGGRGGGGGGSRTFASRGGQSQSGEGRPPRENSSSNAGGFQGSIDTWANPNENNQNSGDRNQSENFKQVERDQGQGGRRGGGRSSGRGGGQSGKDAFDNAGNWGDDFPNADEWDNEEYTGSLADTKVFTASGGQPQPGQKQRTPQPQGQQQQQPQGQSSQRGFNLTSNGPNSYSQSIDLSTLLQKPTTQSSVGTSSAAPGAQFNQQATETLKAVVGIGQSGPASSKDNMYPSYAQASAFTNIKGSQGSQGQKPPSSQAVGARPGGGSAGSSRVPTSSMGAPAVEMPGDSLGRLDVQFGGLDLQFGGSGNSANSDNISGFEFGTSGSKVADDDKAVKAKESYAPSAKEVNKSLSNALTSGGKLNPTASTAANNDSFSKAASQSASSSTAINSVPTVPVAPGSSSSSANTANFNTTKQQDLTYPGYNYNKSYNTNYQQYQYPNNQFSAAAASQQGQQAAQQGTANNSNFKGQYDKYDPQLNNPAAAVLGLANTSTTNALSGKVSATTASKVNMPNLPPGVASALMHPQYMGLAPAAYFGLQQPAMYGAYGTGTGLEDLAAIQRATASATGMHTLPTTGYYDPNNQFATASNLGGNVNSNRGQGESGNSSNSLIAASTASTASTSSTSALSSSTSGFGSASTSSEAASATNTSTSSSGQHQVQQQPQQPQQQTAFNPLATNAFAAQQMPPGYAYYFGNMGLQPYGAATTPAGHVYPPTAMTVPGATATSQFQKSYGTSYGSGYETLGQQGNKDFSSNYSSNGQSKSNAAGGSAAAGAGAHQYWGNTLTSTQLW